MVPTSSTQGSPSASNRRKRSSLPIRGCRPFDRGDVRHRADHRRSARSGPFLQEAALEAHPRTRVDDVMTMDGRLSLNVAQPRFYAIVVGVFAALALLFAASGIYGLLSYTVAQRGEIGICMAVGARRGDILRLMVRQGAILVPAGAFVGLAAAAVSSRAYAPLPTTGGPSSRCRSCCSPCRSRHAGSRPGGRHGSIRWRFSASSRDRWDASDARTCHEAGRRRSAGPWLGRTGASARRSARDRRPRVRPNGVGLGGLVADTERDVGCPPMCFAGKPPRPLSPPPDSCKPLHQSCPINGARKRQAPSLPLISARTSPDHLCLPRNRSAPRARQAPASKGPPSRAGDPQGPIPTPTPSRFQQYRR